MYPTEVQVNEKNLEKLVKTYKNAYIGIIKELENATDFGTRNRKAILAQIEAILTELGDKIGEVVSEDIPLAYELGSNNAVEQLQHLKANVDFSGTFNRIHQEAIVALVDDTAKAFAEGISGVNRSAQLFLNKAVKEQITQKMAQGVISGNAIREVKKDIVALIKDQGLDALVDKGGHSWTLDRYSEMLYRTKVVEARNTGMANRMVQNGYDLVQVSDHNSDHEACARWEGKILSITGRTKGYPTLAQAQSDGIFHPNCKHAINVLVPELAKETKAYKNTYNRR